MKYDILLKKKKKKKATAEYQIMSYLKKRGFWITQLAQKEHQREKSVHDSGMQ